MGLRSTLRLFTTTRRFLRALDRIAAAEEQQTLLLTRLADHLAPEPIPFHPEDLRDTGPSYVRDAEQGRILDYIEKCQRDLKRDPTEEEIIRYLDGVEARL